MKELIAKIRAWLRKRFPSLQFTQQNIEGVLSMAARRVRKNSVVKKNLTTDGVGSAENAHTTDGDTGNAENPGVSDGSDFNGLARIIMLKMIQIPCFFLLTIEIF